MSEINKDLRPKVGVGVYIINDKNQVLLLLRNASHGSGTWCPPGGHMEYGESFFETGARETKEETDLDVSEIELVGVTNDIYKEETKHYITLHLRARNYKGEERIMELDKASDMRWFSFDALPDNLFLSAKNFLIESGGVKKINNVM